MSSLNRRPGFPQQTRRNARTSMGASAGVLVAMTAAEAARAEADVASPSPSAQGYRDAQTLEGVTNTIANPDGSVSLVLADGRTVVIIPENVVSREGATLLSESALMDAGVLPTSSDDGLAAWGVEEVFATAIYAGAAAVVADRNPPNGRSEEPAPNTAPRFTSGDSATMAENASGVVYTAAADTDGGPLTYSISGADAALFSMDAETGAVRFLSTPDYETPADADSGNTYEFVVTASDGANSTDQAVTLTVTNVSDVAPNFTSGGSATLAENASGVVYTAAASDAEGDGVRYSLSGADAALFTIDAETGAVRFVSSPDYEAPTDADSDNAYELVVTASDGTNSTDQAVTLTVTNVVDAAPSFTSGGTAAIAENAGGAVYTAAANTDGGDAVSYSLSGTDAALFTIDASTGAVSFVSSPDFEAPADADSDNTYELVVTASDGTFTADQNVSVTVNNVNDAAPSFTSSTMTAAFETDTGTVYTAAAPDADDDAVSYSLSGADAALFSIDANTGDVSFVSSPDFEAPADADTDNAYEFTVTATDGTFNADQAVTLTLNDLRETNVDLTGLAASDGVIIQGDVDGDFAGGSVSIVGDLNGDGFDDFIVGARFGDDGGTIAGEAYVIYGSNTPTSVDLSSLSPTDGFIIQGDQTLDYAGSSVSGAGDVNGDGFDDLIISAPFGDDGGTNVGEAYVIYGSATGAFIDLSSLAPSDGFIIEGDAVNDFAGDSVSGAGDVNGDGFDDLIIGAAQGDDGGGSAGEAYIVFGSASPTDLDLTGLSGSDGFIIQGDTANDFAGDSVSGAGDVNGDGFDDVIVGAAQGDDGGNNAGEAYVVFGSASPNFVDLTGLSGADGFIIQGDVAGDVAGISVSTAGDVNGDGYDDVIVGARDANATGVAYVIYGSASPAFIDLSSLSSSQGFIIEGDGVSDFTGRSVSGAGDVNGDGYDDVIVGAELGDDGGTNAGEAYVVFGSANPSAVDLSSLSLSEGFIIQGDEASDRAGTSVSGGGDVNGDGYDDVIVGAERGDDGGSDAGEAYVVYGAPTTASTAETLTGTSGADALVGSALNDTISGGGGADVLRGGAGDDVISIADGSFAQIDGGGGDDTLVVTGGLDIDFAVVDNTRIANVERLDLKTDAGANDIRLSASDVIALTGSEANSGNATILRITGDGGDTVAFNDSIDWTQSGTVSEDAVTYDVYANGAVQVYVDQDVSDLMPR